MLVKSVSAGGEMARIAESACGDLANNNNKISIEMAIKRKHRNIGMAAYQLYLAKIIMKLAQHVQYGMK